MMSVAFKLLLLPAAARGWSSCTFPHVDWLVSDTGDTDGARGQSDISATQRVAGMGSAAYIGGYTMGIQSLQSSASTATVTRTDDDGDTMDMHLSKITSAGVPTNIWIFKGSTKSKSSFSDLHKFPDLVHLATAGYFYGTLTVPGTSGDITLTVPTGVGSSIGFVTKFNTNTGKAAWAKIIG